MILVLNVSCFSGRYATPLGTQLAQHSHCYPHYTGTSIRVLSASDLACEIETGFVCHIRHVVTSSTMKHVHDGTDAFSTKCAELSRRAIMPPSPVHVLGHEDPVSRELVTRLPEIYVAVTTLAKTRDAPRRD
jgi:hypothetical protein